MTGNLTNAHCPTPPRNPSFRAKQADAFSPFPLLRNVGQWREKSLFAFTGFITGLLVLTLAMNAQAPVAVPIPKEPHHHLVLENDYVRVFRVSLPAHDATLLHQHDVPYLYVSLGPADVINAVQGRPESRIVMTDGQVGYSPGHFAHIARTDAGSAFDNVTIELLKPQGEPQNLCEKIMDGPLGACNQPSSSQMDSKLPTRMHLDTFKTKPLFETDEVRVVTVSLAAKTRYTQSATFGMLFVVANGSEVQIALPGKPSKSLSGGEVFWLNRGESRVIAGPPEHGTSKYLTLFFKNGKTPAHP